MKTFYQEKILLAKIKKFKNLLDEQYKTSKDYKPKLEWYEGAWSRYRPEKVKIKEEEVDQN